MIRLFSGDGGRPCKIDANRLDRRVRTRGSCRRGPSIRQRLLWERHYDESTGVAAARRQAPQIVLPAPRNTRRFCVLGGVERRAPGFLP
ncbi:hypothetical protein [Burkholderia cepacia]|uniref:hypothetical protein n=1 Tax=Burkholderia cepacia TaxID=292 RepID=UPI001CF38FA4|nr:hypothetical protein [Burkholderia cepacia]MCA8356252.1 hypothetical protein [Burkholderia cepacia]